MNKTLDDLLIDETVKQVLRQGTSYSTKNENDSCIYLVETNPSFGEVLLTYQEKGKSRNHLRSVFIPVN